MRVVARPTILCCVDRRDPRDTPESPQWWRWAGDARLQSMFDTRTDAWRAVGLQDEVRQRDSRRARVQTLVLLPLLAAVIAAYALRHRLFGASADTPVRIAAVVAILILGWAIARDVGRVAAPTLFRHLDPASAGTVGFLIRLVTLAIALLVALSIAQVSPTTLVAGGAFTAVIVGLAAQQTLGNLFAGLVLVSARPFRVGQRVRLQAGVLAGETEGVVSSLGLLYTTLARGEDRILIPNNVVLSAAIVPLKEPASVDVRVRLPSGMHPSRVQAVLDEKITTPTRDPATVLLEELDGDEVVVRIKATPERAAEGARLADEVVDALTEDTAVSPPLADTDASR
jgi:small conductance mechanosensitive channel